MLAIEYHKSVPRYLTARYLGPRFNGLYTSALGTTRLADVPPRRLPNDAWVRVRPLLAGICGSDLATLTAQGTTYFSPLTSTPFVFGHEVVGEVTETGKGASSVRVGDRVVLQPTLHCAIRGVAEPCAACSGAGRIKKNKVLEVNIPAGIDEGQRSRLSGKGEPFGSDFV